MRTGKILTVYKVHHPKADIDRLYEKRKDGGRGLVQVEVAYKTEIINIAGHLNTDQCVNIVKNHENTQPNMNSIFKIAAKIIEDLNQTNGKNDAKRDEIQHMKEKLGEVLKKNCKNKAMHGHYVWNIGRQLISEEDSLANKGRHKRN
jgi:hypothetical protein